MPSLIQFYGCLDLSSLIHLGYQLNATVITWCQHLVPGGKELSCDVMLWVQNLHCYDSALLELPVVWTAL
jgi:hypothetical protein